MVLLSAEDGDLRGAERGCVRDGVVMRLVSKESDEVSATEEVFLLCSPSCEVSPSWVGMIAHVKYCGPVASGDRLLGKGETVGVQATEFIRGGGPRT